MGVWSRGACHDLSKRHGRYLVVVLASILAAVKTTWFGDALTSVPVVHSIHPGEQNHTALESEQEVDVGHTSIFQVDMELRIKQVQRRRLIRILNQFTDMRKHQRVIRELAGQGPDGSHLVNQSNIAIEPGETGPPPELAQLLAIEARMRRLRHVRRILMAKKAAAKSRQELAVLRRDPVRKAAKTILTVCGSSLGVCLAAKAYPRISQVVKAGWNDREENTWLKDVGKNADKKYSEFQDVLQPWFESVQPFVDYFWQAWIWRRFQRCLMASKAREIQEASDIHVPDVALEDVAGIGSAKTEALEIVECLMAPARFASLGARCPKGLLLTGPPGCGKTLLAKAIAATAAVPCLARSGADFNQRYAGTGTTMVKELFATARRISPAVILIDELDYLGRQRGEERGGGLETDRAAALTQLLAEMDGFGSADGVVVIGTTNRPDILDKALTRPGRFDRKVTVPLPDVVGRYQILRKHSKRLVLEGNSKLTGPESSTAPDWMAWAKRTTGFSGADLAGLINEAAMAAAREGSSAVGERHLQMAYSKALIGIPSGRHQSAAEMNVTAFHEAGHAVVNEVMRVSLGASGINGFRTVAHISIVPAGGTGGVTQFADPEEASRIPQSRKVLLAMLAVDMGGRAAEELILGQGQATMGAQADIDDATRMATAMVAAGGLSKAVGPRSLQAGVAPSQALLSVVDAEVKVLLDEALAAARQALQRNGALHAAVAEVLIQRETLDGKVIEAVWGRAQKSLAFVLCLLRATIAAMWAFCRDMYLQHKRRVVLRDWTELEFCPPEIQRDREAVLCAVKQNWQAFEFAWEDLRGDLEIAKEAIEQDWRALRYATPAVRADRELMMLAVEKSNGWALEFAAEELFGDAQLLRDATSRLSGRLGMPLSPITTLVPIDSESNPEAVDPLSLFETSLPLAVLRAQRLSGNAEPLNTELAAQDELPENFQQDSTDASDEQRNRDETGQILRAPNENPDSILEVDRTLDMHGPASEVEPDSMLEVDGSETVDNAEVDG